MISEPEESLGVVAQRSSGPGAARFQHDIKRAVDVLVAAVALLILSPVFIVIAVAIRLTSRGSVFYRQRRMGQGGHQFELLKFRTMVTGADRRLEEVLHLNRASGPLFKTRNDPRLTPVGRFLRRHYMDELPQLINVLRGEMSLVGPRPCLPEEMMAMTEQLAPRLSVPQGITGPWQANGHHTVSFEEQVSIELAYIENWSVGRDFAILLKTIPLVLRGTGL